MAKVGCEMVSLRTFWRESTIKYEAKCVSVLMYGEGTPPMLIKAI